MTGPFAAGKTSLIQSVSQSPVVSTDVATSGNESMVKMLTTVALDFGTFRIEGGGEGPDEPAEGVQLLLFGTPGQERFWFMTDVLKGDVDVTVFVVDAEAEHTHGEAGAAMRALLKDLRVPLVVAVNRCDDADHGDRAGPISRSPVVRARRPLSIDRPRERPRRRDRGAADAAGVDGTTGGGMAFRGAAVGGCAVTFAAPTPDLLRFEVAWPRPPWTQGGPTARPLPPPPRDAVPLPGPALWLPFDRPPVADVIVGREVADAFELIWPTGEIDEQFLGGPLSEMPQPGAEHSDRRESGSENGHVSDDIVLAIQRTIAAIGADSAAIEAPPSAPRLPDPVTGAATRDLDRRRMDRCASRHEPTDGRSSALRRLISGLRRR